MYRTRTTSYSTKYLYDDAGRDSDSVCACVCVCVSCSRWAWNFKSTLASQSTALLASLVCITRWAQQRRVAYVRWPKGGEGARVGCAGCTQTKSNKRQQHWQKVGRRQGGETGRGGGVERECAALQLSFTYVHRFQLKRSCCCCCWRCCC